jgi:hypothetical protein
MEITKKFFILFSQNKKNNSQRSHPKCFGIIVTKKEGSKQQLDSSDEFTLSECE